MTQALSFHRSIGTGSNKQSSLNLYNTNNCHVPGCSVLPLLRRLLPLDPLCWRPVANNNSNSNTRYRVARLPFSSCDSSNVLERERTCGKQVKWWLLDVKKFQNDNCWRRIVQEWHFQQRWRWTVWRSSRNLPATAAATDVVQCRHQCEGSGDQFVQPIRHRVFVGFVHTGLFDLF